MAISLKMAAGDEALSAAVRRSHQLLHRRALAGAVASAVPIPGLDWAVDAALLSCLLPRISAEFGLAPAQLDRLDPDKRAQVQKAVAVVGSVLIGKFITKELVFMAAQKIGMRLTVQQAAKYVPLVGQAVSAAMGYTAIRYLGEQHIQDCLRVVQTAQLALPSPASAAKATALLGRTLKKA